jgi:energy-coupling factor transport system substrate-specific component
MNTRWRTVDIVVASILAVVFGVIFWAWGLLWNGPGEVLFGTFKPAAALIYGVWLLPAVLAPLIIQKPGAALYTEFIAATVSALLGTGWGITVLWYGLAQGIAGELGYAAYGYKKFGLPQALFASVLTGAAAAGLDLFYWYADWQVSWQVTYFGLVIASTVVIAGLGGLGLTRGLSSTGVLDRFPSGRTRELV